MKNKGTLIAIITIGLIYLSICSCKQNSAKIGMLIASPVFEPELAFFSGIISKAGFEVTSANANYDDKLQIAQAKELIDKGIKVLVIIPVNTNTAAAIVRLANERNVKSIAYERIISNCKLDYSISFDNVRIGELMAREALRIKPTGNYYIINGDRYDQNAVWVREGFYKAMEPSIKTGKIKVVYDSYIEDWAADNALYEFKRYVNLSGNMPDVILSAYNGMNTGIFDYFKEENISQLPLITGQDMDTEQTRTSTNANQHIRLYKSSKIEAESAANLALKLLNNDKIDVDQKINNGLVDVNAIIIKEMKVESID